MSPLASYLPTHVASVLAAWLVVKAYREARTPIAIDALRDRLLADVRARAERGHWPDWSTYRETIDREFVPTSDRLRLYASTALAIGLFGTVAFFIFEGLIGGAYGSSISAAARLQNDLTRALWGPLIGVLAHLAIVRLVYRADQAHQKHSLGIIRHLEEEGSRSPPVQTLEKTLREEIQSFQTTLGGELVTALRSALQGFPQATESFGQQMTAFSGVVADQRKTLALAVDKLQATLGSVSALAMRTAELAEQLAELPPAIAKLLEESDSRALSRERELLGHVTETREALASLPATLREALATGASEAAEQLGRTTTQYAANLRAALQEDHQSLLAQHDILREEIRQLDHAWRRNVAEMLRGVVDTTSTVIQQELAPALRESTDHLVQAAKQVAVYIQAQAELQDESLRRLAAVTAKWTGVSAEANGAAEAFKFLQVQLGATAQVFHQIGGELKILPNQLQKIVSELSATLQASSTKQEAIDDLRLSTSQLVRELDTRHDQLGKLLNAQSDVLRALLQELIDSAF